MKFNSPLIVVNDMEKSKKFYREVLGLRVVMDLGANVTLTGGVALQTLDSWVKFIHKKESDIHFGGNNTELYFEEDNFDEFSKRLKQIPNIEFIHDVEERSWGQRTVSFYDPDKHIIEVGENLKSVCRKFLDSGMTPEEVAKRMDTPIKFVNSCMR